MVKIIKGINLNVLYNSKNIYKKKNKIFLVILMEKAASIEKPKVH